MNYVGIRGHRGSGKKSFAALLGNTMDILLEYPSSCRYYNEDARAAFDSNYDKWVKAIMTSPDNIPSEIANLQYVYLDAFGDIPKTFVQLMLGVTAEDLDNNDTKDNLIINLKDFSKSWRCELAEDVELMSAEQVYKMRHTMSAPSIIKFDTYMTLREFILYFGKDIMQRYMGLNVWIKALNANSELFNNLFSEDTSYKIYYDIKTKSEVSYVKDKGGIIIKISRPNHKKDGRYVDDLRSDNRYDYTVTINGDLMSVKEDVWKIANEIIRNTHGKKEENN